MFQAWWECRFNAQTVPVQTSWLLFSAYLSFHSYSLNLHFPYYAEQSASVNLSPFYLLQCSFHFIDILSLRNVEKWLFLSLFSLFSVGTTAAQTAAGSVTPWTQMTSTPARPLAPTSTPHLSHTETWMNRSVIDTRASWSTESETSAEVHVRNNFKTLFSFHI